MANRQNSLLSLADDAKNLGGYVIANEIFRYLLSRVLAGFLPRLKLTLETEGYGDEYYDLVVLVHRGSDERLCIPLPLLTAEAVCRIYKYGIEEEEREGHDREGWAFSEEERSQRLEEIQAVLNKIPRFLDVGNDILATGTEVTSDLPGMERPRSIDRWMR